MHGAHLTLHDFRSYADIDVALEPGAMRPITSTAAARAGVQVSAPAYSPELSS